MAETAIMRSRRQVPACAIVVFLAALMLGVTACGPSSPAGLRGSPTSTPGLRAIQKAKYLRASLSGLVIMPFGTQANILPILLDIPSVPIQWNGTIFDGTVKGAGPNGGTTVQVHGSVSDDGEWVETMSFNRQVASGGTGSIDFCQVILQEVPITPVTGNVTAIGAFLKSGADVQKHVEKLLYTQGGGTMGTVPLSFNSLLWDNAAQPPVLKLAFEKVASADITSGTVWFGH